MFGGVREALSVSLLIKPKKITMVENVHHLQIKQESFHV